MAVIQSSSKLKTFLFLQSIGNVYSNLPPVIKQKKLVKHGLFDLNRVLNNIFIYLGIMFSYV